MSNLGQALFVSHGGGPMPLLHDPSHDQMVSTLSELSTQIKQPKAIIVVSAHWEAEPIAITAHASPGLLYDYYGFPAASYQFAYPAPGHQKLAQSIHKQLQAEGLQASLDERRDWDHGVFVPLLLLFPDANIPVVQVSLHPSLNIETHIRLGEALASLINEHTLLVGSGFSFHNMRAFFSPLSSEDQQQNRAFESWIHDTVTQPFSANPWQHWASAPGARYCHPREEHLLPLTVLAAAMNRPAEVRSEFALGSISASHYLWR